MLRVLEYDQAEDGGFIAWIEDGPDQSWFAHHEITAGWKVTTPAGADACRLLAAEALGELIALAAERERQAGWNIQYHRHHHPG